MYKYNTILPILYNEMNNEYLWLRSVIVEFWKWYNMFCRNCVKSAKTPTSPQITQKTNFSLGIYYFVCCTSPNRHRHNGYNIIIICDLQGDDDGRGVSIFIIIIIIRILYRDCDGLERSNHMCSVSIYITGRPTGI